MLPDRVIELLTSYVDSELGERQQLEVQRLLSRSAEARALLRQLQRDADSLHRLAPQPLDEDLSAKVLEALAQHERPVVRYAFPSPRPAWRTWAWFGVAASLITAVSLGSYVYYANLDSEPAAPVIAKKQPQSRPMRSRRGPESEAVAKVPEQAAPTSEGEPDGPLTLPRERLVPDAAPETRQPVVAKPATGATKGDDVLAAPSAKMEVFELVNARSALSMAFQDLGQETARRQLRLELKKEGALRLELFSEGDGRVMDRLEAALAAHGFRLLIDQIAQARLRVRGWKTDFVLFVEDVTADELEAILRNVGAAAQKSESKYPSARFSQLLVLPLTPPDHKELAKLLGVDPTQIEPVRKGPLGVDVRSPLAKTTAEELHKSLAGQGTPRPKGSKSSGTQGPLRNVLLLSYNPVRTRPAQSPEVKRFFDGRIVRRPGTLQVLLVLRGVAG